MAADISEVIAVSTYAHQISRYQADDIIIA